MICNLSTKVIFCFVKYKMGNSCTARIHPAENYPPKMSKRMKLVCVPNFTENNTKKIVRRYRSPRRKHLVHYY